MPYPSLLWKKVLSEYTDPAENSEYNWKIPENIITDLYLHEELRPRTLPLMRQPCSAEEIPMRQNLFRTLLDCETLKRELQDLREKIDYLDRLISRLDRSEFEEESVILFLPVIRNFTEIAEAWASYADAENRLGEIGRYFKLLLEDRTVSECAKRCTDILAKRQSEIKLTIRGGQVYASEGGEMLRGRFENTFRKMGLDDAVPPAKHPTFATPSITRSYAEVYAGYYEIAKGFSHMYRETFLEGAYDLHELAGYAEEISFLLDTVQYFEKLEKSGYALCYPTVSSERIVELDGVRDPSLLRRDVTGGNVVPNDVRMASEKDGEKLNFFILSGANGGGKTTFLRSCGLAVLFFITGCPVVAEKGRMYPFDSLYAHFPSNESFENSGRFVNEAERADAILNAATPDSFTLFNETYSGTDEKKSEDYSSRLANALYERGVFGIYVTHIHALTGGKIPTLAAVIDEGDENRRTYKIRRVGGTKSSFAADILEKYRLDRVSLTERLEEYRKERHHG